MDKFEEIIAPLLGEYEDLSQETVFGIRIMFHDYATGERVEHMLPYLTVTEDLANAMLHKVLHTYDGLRVLAAWTIGRNFGPTLVPEAGRIVRLAEIPF